MYWAVDAGCFLLGLGWTCAGLWGGEWLMALAGTLWVWTYPLLLETGYNMAAQWGEPASYCMKSQSRFVYHPHYNISLWGLEKYHPFDSRKYQRIFAHLSSRKSIAPLLPVAPAKPSRHFLLERMGRLYLLKLCYGVGLCRLLELPFWFLPAWVLRWRVLDSMLLATEGSILAACLANSLGWAVNLSGGFHHASFDRGGGFCLYPDISLTVHYVQSRLGLRRVMIVDLDAHQGNGHERDFRVNDDVYIVDCYNPKIYPWDSEVREAIDKNLPIQSSTSDQEYLACVDSLRQDFDYFRPDFVIYNAGTDVLAGDPLGKLQISREAIMARDSRVVGLCRGRGVPVVMLLSGGYQTANAELIADSI